ncbi:MAG: hypothetical protein LAN59_03490 [Acidobacteriia bacterium]|nr:hypothetical protein [Terriglobia bacterium]
MSINLSIRALAAPVADPERPHRRRVAAAWALATALVLAIAAYGFDYYTLGAAARPLSPKHALLRPSGAIGIKLGILGVGLFFLIYLYYFRKRWKWLGRLGVNRHWLDFHVVLGVASPVIIAFHSAFKFRGIAGMAFWIMLAVALSGIVGRYLYAQIPRHLNAAELSWQELQEEQLTLASQMASQKVFPADRLVAAFHVPSAEMVKHKSAIGAIVWMLMLDLVRPFRVASLRRQVLGFGGIIFSLGGLLRSTHDELETVVRIAQQQAALSKRMVFLSRTQEIFQLWHVIHRPFSYAFIVLALLHIGTAMLLGYL